MLTIGSLFSGIGGLELGLERAGLGPVRWQVEIDPYCRAVLAKHWPDARRYEDVRSVGPELERVDLVCGGFPCQDISTAGNMAGITGARSGLWKEYARILGVARPRFVVVENVGALASRGLDVVLGDLADLGFDAEWFPVAAADVGAPHLRERIFVVGYANVRGEPDGAEHDEAPWVPTVADASSVGRERAWRARHGRGGPSDGCVSLADADGARLEGRHGGIVRECPGERPAWESGSQGAGPQGGWIAEPNVGRVAYGVPSRVDRIAALGNAVVPQVAEVVGWVVRGIAERAS